MRPCQRKTRMLPSSCHAHDDACFATPKKAEASVWAADAKYQKTSQRTSCNCDHRSPPTPSSGGSLSRGTSLGSSQDTHHSDYPRYYPAEISLWLQQRVQFSKHPLYLFYHQAFWGPAGPAAIALAPTLPAS